jgi:hypothetical protein
VSGETTPARMLRLAALGGMIGPPLFAGMLLLLTTLEYDFMRSLRWDPIRAATTDWPSGLALGPYGVWMIATFLVSGLLLMFFALNLRALFPAGLGPGLLFISGLALMSLSSLTDPTYTGAPPFPTLHGQIHDAAYAVLGLSFLPGLVLLALEFRKRPEWRIHARITWLVLLLALPGFYIKGITFYAFLASVMCWYELTAVRIWRLLAKG